MEKRGSKLAEGKTKLIFQANDNPKHILISSKDSITAGNGLKKDELPRKGEYSTTTTCNVFRVLHLSAIPTHFVRQEDATTFRALKCAMIPLEVIVRRIATGSWLKRHPNDFQGKRFDPAVVEFTFKDDALGDPLISDEEIVEKKMQFGAVTVDFSVINYLKKLALSAFAVVERAWHALDVVLVDFKVEFGVTTDGTIVLADVIDNDSWRIWPHGDPSMMKDKQVYRNLPGPLSDEHKEMILKNYAWVAQQPLIDSLIRPTEDTVPPVAIIMGSQSDWDTMKSAAVILEKLGIAYESRIVSAHRTPERMFAFAKSAKSKGYKVIIAGAGGAAHLPGMVASLTTLPVLGVPVQSKALSGIDSLLSILQMPSGVPVGTLAIGTAGATNAALLAASILSSSDNYPHITKALSHYRDQQTADVAEYPSSNETVHAAPIVEVPKAIPAVKQFPAKVLPPGSTIGIIGGGQLAKMICTAAATLGYKTHVYCPDKVSPAFTVTDKSTIAEYSDRKSLAHFAGLVDVVTYEFENVPLETAEYLAQFAPVRPNPKVLAISQNRKLEKQFANSVGVPTTKFEFVTSLEDLQAAADKIGYPAILKTNTMGYDGKGQIYIKKGENLASVWAEMSRHSKEAILEAFVDFEKECSVIVSRGFGSTITFPVVENRHENHILKETLVPADLPEAVCSKAAGAAIKVAENIDLVGVMAVEFFVTKSGEVLLNEIAPRPHNSGHWSIEGASSSQFDQLVRSICGLPLGSIKLLAKKIVMKNLLGSEINSWSSYLTQDNAHVHVYGKTEIREGRKMGHVTILNL